MAAVHKHHPRLFKAGADPINTPITSSSRHQQRSSGPKVFENGDISDLFENVYNEYPDIPKYINEFQINLKENASIDWNLAVEGITSKSKSHSDVESKRNESVGTEGKYSEINKTLSLSNLSKVKMKPSIIVFKKKKLSHLTSGKNIYTHNLSTPDIDNYDDSKSKVSCLRCRKSKKKCTRSLPECSNCVNSDELCVYLPRKMKSTKNDKRKKQSLIDDNSMSIDKLITTPTPTSTPTPTRTSVSTTTSVSNFESKNDISWENLPVMGNEVPPPILQCSIDQDSNFYLFSQKFNDKDNFRTISRKRSSLPNMMVRPQLDSEMKQSQAHSQPQPQWQYRLINKDIYSSYERLPANNEKQSTISADIERFDNYEQQSQFPKPKRHKNDFDKILN